MDYSIFMSGGGSANETFALDDLFFRTAGERILYLPVGLKRTFAGYDGCVNWFTDTVSLHGLTKKISVWIDVKDKAIKINKNNFDAIYIGGASDTLRLHSLFIKHNIYPFLFSFVKNGGIIYGGSGGATILGRSINYDQIEKGLPKVLENSANIFFEYSVFTHLDKNNRFILEGLSEGCVVGIPEGAGIAVNIIEKSILYLGRTDGILISEKVTQTLRDGEITKNF